MFLAVLYYCSTRSVGLCKAYTSTVSYTFIPNAIKLASVLRHDPLECGSASIFCCDLSGAAVFTVSL